MVNFMRVGTYTQMTGVSEDANPKFDKGLVSQPSMFFFAGEPNEGSGPLPHPGGFAIAAGAPQSQGVSQHRREAGLGRIGFAGEAPCSWIHMFLDPYARV